MGEIPKDLPSIEAIVGLAYVYHDQSKWKEAAEMYRKALAGYEKVLGPEHHSTLLTVENLGNMLTWIDPEEALRMIERAQAGYEKLFGPEDESNFRTYHIMGNILGKQNKVKESKQMYERALVGLKRIFGDDGDATLRARYMLGVRLAALQKYEEAVEVLEPTLQTREKALGWNDARTISVGHELGNVYVDVGRSAEAEILCLKVLTARENFNGKVHENTLSTVIALGNAYYGQKKWGLAETQYERALKGREQLLGDDSLDTLAACYNLGLCQLAGKKLSVAEKSLRRVYEGRKTVLGLKNVETINAAKELASCYREQKKFGDAERVLQQVIGNIGQVKEDANHDDTNVKEKKTGEKKGVKKWTTKLFSSRKKTESTATVAQSEKASGSLAVTTNSKNSLPITQTSTNISTTGSTRHSLTSKTSPVVELSAPATGVSTSKNARSSARHEQTFENDSTVVQASIEKSNLSSSHSAARPSTTEQPSIPSAEVSSSQPKSVSRPKVATSSVKLVKSLVERVKPPEIPKLILPENVARKLVDAGMDPTNPDILIQQYPLFWACKMGHLDVVKVLLQGDDRHHYFESHPYLGRRWSDISSIWYEKTPFRVALDAGHLEIVELLFKYGVKADYGKRDEEMITAVCVDRKLRERVMRETFTTTSGEGYRPFRDAIERQELETARLLLKYGAKTGYTIGDREKIFRECKGHWILLCMVLEQVFKVPEPEGSVSFQKVVYDRDWMTARLLLENGTRSGYSKRDKEKMVTDCGHNLELMVLILKDVFGSEAYDSKIWVLIFAIKQDKVELTRMMWEECAAYVNRSTVHTTSDALYYLWRNFCKLGSGKSAVLEYLYDCGAVDAIEAMWNRCDRSIRDDTSLPTLTRDQLAIRRMRVFKEHEGMLDPAILNWD